MKSITRQPISYSKGQKRIIYFIGGALIAMLLFIFFYQGKMTSETLQSGKRFQVAVINLDCTNGKTKSRLYFRNEEGKINHVNISYQECQKFKLGDTIAVFENKDWYEIDPISLEKVKATY